LALSPDGRRVAFQGRQVANGRPQLYVQPLDGTPAVPVPNTETGYAMFWSRDSRYLYYFDRDGLHRLSVDSGGSVVVIAKVPNVFFGAAAVSDDQVLLGGATLRLWNVKDGSFRTLLEQPGQQYFIPTLLPDARRFLFLQSDSSPVLSGRLGSLDSKDTTQIVSGDISNIGYASGALVFARGDTVYAQRAETDGFRLAGDPVAVARSVDASPGRGAAFSVSANGALVYQAVDSRPLFRLTWVDRQGHTLKTVGDDADYSNLELGKDRRHLLTSITDSRFQTRDIFIVDLDRAIRQRFTSDPSDERSAVWSPDGTRVLYTSKNLDFYERNADASGSEKAVLKNSDNKDIYAWSADGALLLYRRLDAATGNDVWIAPADGSSPGRAIANSAFNELPGGFSPDAKRVVYSSDESGQSEIYVIGIDGRGKTQVSSSGGAFPRWRGDGKEILYLSPQRSLMSAPVGPGPAFEIGVAGALFPMNATMRPGVYDVTADGQRFIVAAPVPSRLPPSLTVLTNWPQLLAQKP
jgi:Tol biopolymer transport system component